MNRYPPRAPSTVDTGQIAAKNAFVLGVEATARRGPLSLQGEVLNAFVDRASAGFPGCYLMGAYLLTGETRPYDRPRPRSTASRKAGNHQIRSRAQTGYPLLLS